MIQIQCWYGSSKINICGKNVPVSLMCNSVVLKDASCIARYPYTHLKQNHCLNSKAGHHNQEEKVAVNTIDQWEKKTQPYGSNLVHNTRLREQTQYLSPIKQYSIYKRDFHKKSRIKFQVTSMADKIIITFDRTKNCMYMRPCWIWI